MKMKRSVRLMVLFSCLSFSVATFAEGDKQTSLTQSTYKSLEKIQKLIGENSNQQAITELTALYGKIEKDTMDEAVVAQTFAYAEMNLSNYPKAITHFKKSIELGLLPESTDINIRYMLAQLYSSEGNFKDALIYAESWYKSLKEVKASEEIFMANLYVQSKQFKPAIPYIEKAIAKETKPNESWYQLLVASHYELKQYTQAATVLKEMIGRWPDKKTYWEQLASIYLTLNKEADALAILDLAWRHGILEKETSVKTLVQFAISFGIPDRGARILERAIKEEKVASNEQTLEVLCSAWSLAKEFDKAIASYQQLVAISRDGKPMVRLAHLYIEKEDWGNAQSTLQKAIDVGLDDKSDAYLLLGIAYVKDEKIDEGKEALRKAAAYPKTKGQAEVWINFANQKLQSLNRIARAN